MNVRRYFQFLFKRKNSWMYPQSHRHIGKSNNGSKYPFIY